MPDQQWHVFYRTTGMQDMKQRGWLRADFLADSAPAALDLLLVGKQSVLAARVYPGASAYVAGVEWANPTIHVRHEPHGGRHQSGTRGDLMRMQHQIRFSHRRYELLRTSQLGKDIADPTESEVEVGVESGDLVEAWAELFSRLPTDVYAAAKKAMEHDRGAGPEEEA